MFNVYAWLLAALVLIPFAVFSAFMVLCTARAVRDSGTEFPPGMLTVARLWLVVGWPADVLFNWTWGAYIFKEWRGVSFSAHIQWRVDQGLWDPHTQLWTAFLNRAAPNHIRVPA